MAICCCFEGVARKPLLKKRRSSRRVGFGPVSLIHLVRQHPKLVNRGILRHPAKLLTLLSRTDAQAVQQLCARLPDEALDDLFPEILEDLSRKKIHQVFAPLVSDPEIHDSLISLIAVLDARAMVEVLSRGAPEKLAVVLRAPPEKLTPLIKQLDEGRFIAVVVPILQEPVELLEQILLPLLQKVEDPGKLAAFANHVEEQVLVWFLRGGHPDELAAIVNALDPTDFEKGGSATLLLQALADERGLTRDKVLPLLHKGEPAKIVPLVQGVKAAQLLEVLRRVQVEGVIRVLNSTNIDLVVRLFNGPLENAVTLVAGGLADAMKLPGVEHTVRQVTDALNSHIVQVESDWQKIVQRGKEERGGEKPNPVADFTRGLWAEAVDRGKEALEKAQRKNPRLRGASMDSVQDYDGATAMHRSQSAGPIPQSGNALSGPRVKDGESPMPSRPPSPWKLVGPSPAFSADISAIAASSASSSSVQPPHKGLLQSPDISAPCVCTNLKKGAGERLQTTPERATPRDSADGKVHEAERSPSPEAQASHGQGASSDTVEYVGPRLLPPAIGLAHPPSIGGAELQVVFQEAVDHGREVFRETVTAADRLAEEWKHASQTVLDRGRAAASGFNCSMTAHRTHASEADTEVRF